MRHTLLCPRWFLKTDVYLHLDEKAVPCRLYSPGANTLYTASKCNGCIKVSEEDWLFELDVMQKWLCIWRCEIIESKLLYGSIEMQILKS